METIKEETELFDKNQSIEVIKGMIRVSQKKLRNDGILFILWGWLMFYNYTSSYLIGRMVVTYHLKRMLDYLGFALGAFAIGYSIYYIYSQRKRLQTYIGISLRYVWMGLIIAMMLTNLTIFNVIHEVNFELQHPIFMILIAFATVVTGGIMRYKLIVFGGIIFGVLAYVSSFFDL